MPNKFTHQAHDDVIVWILVCTEQLLTSTKTGFPKLLFGLVGLIGPNRVLQAQ